MRRGQLPLLGFLSTCRCSFKPTGQCTKPLPHQHLVYSKTLMGWSATIPPAFSCNEGEGEGERGEDSDGTECHTSPFVFLPKSFASYLHRIYADVRTPMRFDATSLNTDLVTRSGASQKPKLTSYSAPSSRPPAFSALQ